MLSKLQSLNSEFKSQVQSARRKKMILYETKTRLKCKINKKIQFLFLYPLMIYNPGLDSFRFFGYANHFDDLGYFLEYLPICTIRITNVKATSPECLRSVTRNILFKILFSKISGHCSRGNK